MNFGTMVPKHSTNIQTNIYIRIFVKGFSIQIAFFDNI